MTNGEGRGFGDCHTRISCMVPLYQCTVKACKKKVTIVAGVSHRQIRHSYSYYHDHIPLPLLLLQQVDIVSDTYSQLIPLALEVESKGLLLRALFVPVGVQLVDPEFEYLQQNTVLANSLYCTGKQCILYWQTVYTVLEVS